MTVSNAGVSSPVAREHATDGVQAVTSQIAAGDHPISVSVIIPTWNRSRFVAEAVRSVQAVDGPDLALEILVVDNGSTDDTAAVVQAMGVRYVYCETPGAAAARNLGMREATGDYLAFLDDDDVWLSGHLREHLKLLEARKDFIGCIGQVVLTDPEGQPVGAPYPDHLPADGDVFPWLMQNWPQLGAIVMRTAVRDAVGYFDESAQSRNSSRDWDWMLRIAREHKIGHVRVPVVHFRMRHIANPREDDLNVKRAKACRYAFWQNVWRARRRRLSPVMVLRAALRFDGTYTSYFLRSSAEYAARGDRRSALRSLGRAIRISPLHVGWALIHDKSLLSHYLPARAGASATR